MTGNIICRAAAVGILALVLTACGGRPAARFRIYDPADPAAPQVTEADLVVGSIRAQSFPADAGGGAAVDVRLTARGSRKFRALMRELAQRGRRLGRMQASVISLDGRIVSRPRVDYTAFPNGLGPSSGGFELQFGTMRQALAVAARLRAVATAASR